MTHFLVKSGPIKFPKINLKTACAARIHNPTPIFSEPIMKTKMDRTFHGQCGQAPFSKGCILAMFLATVLFSHNADGQLFENLKAFGNRLSVGDPSVANSNNNDGPMAMAGPTSRPPIWMDRLPFILVKPAGNSARRYICTPAWLNCAASFAPI